MEVVTAFFVEAGFIGILLYGDGRVRPATMFAATVMVAIGVSHVGPRRHARLLGQRTPGVVGRVRGPNGRQKWVKAADLRPAKEG